MNTIRAFLKMPARHIIAMVLVIGAALTLAACEVESVTSTTDETDEAALARANDANQVRFNSVYNQVDPHVRYAPDGSSWSLRSGANLSSEARAYANQAQQGWAAAARQYGIKSSISSDGFGPSLSVSASTSAANSITFYWWGARIGMDAGWTAALSDAWRTTGAAGAIRVFLQAYGWSPWAAGAAGYLVPMYAGTIWYVNKMGGGKGVYLNVPWSIVPTIITSR